MYLYERHQKICQNIHFFIYVRITLKRFQVIFDKSILSKVHYLWLLIYLTKISLLKTWGTGLVRSPWTAGFFRGTKSSYPAPHLQVVETPGYLGTCHNLQIVWETLDTLLPCPPSPGSKSSWIPGYSAPPSLGSRSPWIPGYPGYLIVCGARGSLDTLVGDKIKVALCRVV